MTRRFLSLSVGALLLASIAVASSGGATQAEARWVITDLGTVGVATAINERGQIVGFNPNAFLWEKGEVTDLGPGPARTKEDLVTGIAINERGQVLIQQGADRLARMWEDGELKTLEPLANANSSDAYAINDAGLIVGRSKSTRGVWPRAVVWNSEDATPLPQLPGGKKSEALGVNNRGVIVGWSHSRSGDRAVVWRAGHVVPLRDPYGSGIALGLNERGQIFGRTTTGYPLHGLTWTNTKVTDLGALGGRGQTLPYAINNRGQIVGRSEPGAGSKAFFHAFLWDAGRMRDLGTLAGRHVPSIAYDINDRGQVVGESQIDKWYSHIHGFVWEKGRMTDLGTLPGDKWSAALAINERGQIVGWSGQHAVLWTLKR